MWTRYKVVSALVKHQTDSVLLPLATRPILVFARSVLEHLACDLLTYIFFACYSLIHEVARIVTVGVVEVVYVVIGDNDHAVTLAKVGEL